MTAGPEPGLDDPLLERERELAALDAVLEGARAGRGGVVVIDADAGLGKSRLLRTTRMRAAASGMRVLGGRGSELERGFPFGLARQLLPAPATQDRGQVDIPETGDGAGTLAEILELHDQLLALSWQGGDASPLLIAADDLQWADDPSLRFLAHLALRIEHQPIAVVGAVRSGEPNAPDELLQQLRTGPSAQVLAPRLLGDSAVAQMVRAAFGEEAPDQLVAACARATGGNPFYLRELLRTLAAEGKPTRPEHIREIAPRAVLRSIVVRLGRLGASASALARSAAVLGDGAPLRLAAALAELEEEAAEVAADLLARGGILQKGEPLRFLHPLIASTLESDMGAFERAREHRRAADLLLAESAPPARVAAHLMVARPAGDQRVVQVLERAAAEAVTNGTPAVAAGLLTRALEEPPSPDAEPGLMLALAKAEALAGSAAASARFEEALTKINVVDRRVAALVELATVSHLRWDLARAAELAARARAELPPDHPRQEQLLGVELSAALLHPELLEEAWSRFEPVLERARAGEPPSDSRLLALVVGQMGVADPPETVRRLVESAVARDPLIDDSHGTSLGWIAAALEWIDELDLAERWLDEAIRTADKRGAALSSSIAVSNRARVRHFQGRLDLAVIDATRALEIYRYGWITSPWSTPILAMSQIAAGDLDAARETISIGESAGTEGPDHGRLLEARARLHLAEGEFARALECARAVGEIVEGRYGRVQPRVWEWRRLAAEAAHGLGDDRQARELLEPDLRALRDTGPRRQLGHALTIAGLIASEAERVSLLSEAASTLEASPARLQRAETLLHLGAALRRSRERTAAKQPLYTALELAADMGATRLAQHARDELGRLGLRPRRTARSGIASLTPSERQVAALAAEGLSTPQIASRLHVTRNTVETHLRHIYRKLGLSGRGELRDALSEQIAN